jgi:DNA-binding IclR family transcriptional regulator
MKNAFHDVKSDAYGVRAVERAADVLEALAQADQPQSLSTIAARAGLSVPTTFRLLRTLEDRGLVMPHSESGKYTLGFRLLELAHALTGQLDIIAIARPFLTAVRDQVTETTGLLVRTGDHWAHAAHAEALHPVRRVMEIGETAPLYAGCAGKVFLAAASDEEIDGYLRRTPLVPLSPTTPTHPDTLREQIATVRAQGFAESVNERGAGGVGIAAPIRAHNGRVVAALEISGPAERYTAQSRITWITAAIGAADRISAALGFRPVFETTSPQGRILGNGNGVARATRRRDQPSPVSPGS